MPDPTEYTDEKEWMAACVPKRLEEGDAEDQAVAACLGMWREGKSLDLPSAEELADYVAEFKIGARNNKSDRERLQMIHDYSVENGAACKPGDDIPLPKALDDGLVIFGGSVKALDDGGRVGGYLVRFSTAKDPDASPARDYFTKNTDFMVEFPARSAAWFNHAMTPPLKRLSHDADLKMDDFGVWAETVLDERDQYEAFLLDLARKGKLGWSSGTAGHLVDRKAVGDAHEVTIWPLGLDASLTHMPAEPRNNAIPLKSISDLLPLPIPEPEGDDAQEPNEQIDTNPTKNLEVIEMDITQEQFQEMLAQAAAQGAETALKSLPAEPVKAGVVVTKDEADQPWQSNGEFLKAVKLAALYPGREDSRLRPLKATGLSEGVPADGGYLLNPAMNNTIMERMLDTGKILSRCANDVVTNTNSMLYNGIDESTHVGSVFGGVIGYWGSEGGTKSGSKPKFYQLELKLNKIYALMYATDEQLEDTPNLESWIMRNIPEALRWYVESAIVSGDGIGKPLGITAAPCLVSPVRLDANEVNPEDFAAMWARRWTGVDDYVWLINPGVGAAMNTFAVGNWPVYMPQGNMTGKPYATVYGAPVIESEHVPAFKSANDVILASLGQYQTITKGGVQSASSIHVQFVTDETAFRFVYRIDGAPLWNTAVTPENGSTYSPFVGLAAASS